MSDDDRIDRRRERVCARAQELASAFLDGRLDARRRGALQRHLLACTACQRVVRETERLARATHNLPQHRCTPELATRVRGATRERRERRFESLHDGLVTGSHNGAGLRLAQQPAARMALAAAVLTVTWWLGYASGAQQPRDEVRPPDTATSQNAPVDLTAVVRELARQAAGREPDAAQTPATKTPAAIGEFASNDATRRGAANAPPDSDAVTAFDGGTPGLVPRTPRPLEPFEREQLGALLDLEQQLASGHRDAGSKFVRRVEQHFRSSHSFSSSFSIATVRAGAQSLDEAGLAADADALEQLIESMFEHLHRTARRGGDGYGIATPTSSRPRANRSGAAK